MQYLVLATDYDGTLAQQGRVDPATVAALERLAPRAARLSWSLDASGRNWKRSFRDLTCATSWWPKTADCCSGRARIASCRWPSRPRKNSCPNAPPANRTPLARPRNLCRLAAARNSDSGNDPAVGHRLSGHFQQTGGHGSAQPHQQGHGLGRGARANADRYGSSCWHRRRGKRSGVSRRLRRGRSGR